MIGGATTSAAHTAIKISQHYSGPLVHVLDASRSVPVTTALLSENRDSFIAENEAKHEKHRASFSGGPKKETLSLPEARKNAPTFDWENYTPPVPEFTGTRSIKNQSLRELANYIDWTPFFHTWELRGVWNAETKTLKTKNEEGAKVAQELYHEAQTLLERVITEKKLTANGIYGFFPARREGDDIVLPEHNVTFHTLRQQQKKTTEKPNFALSDYVSENTTDYLGGFVVGIHGADEWAAELREAHNVDEAIMVQAIADRLAEAFAELLHHRARISWGIERPGQFTNTELIHEKYQGIRPAPGYPSQPDHTEKPPLFQLLDAEKEIDVSLTESCAMHPGSAVCGLYFSHPESHYFQINDLQKDQIEDYARRKDMNVEEVEKWLGPWLGY